VGGKCLVRLAGPTVAGKTLCRSERRIGACWTSVDHADDTKLQPAVPVGTGGDSESMYCDLVLLVRG
jgi:hypothetical protein